MMHIFIQVSVFLAKQHDFPKLFVFPRFELYVGERGTRGKTNKVLSLNMILTYFWTMWDNIAIFFFSFTSYNTRMLTITNNHYDCISAEMEDTLLYTFVWILYAHFAIVSYIRRYYCTTMTMPLMMVLLWKYFVGKNNVGESGK